MPASSRSPRRHMIMLTLLAAGLLGACADATAPEATVSDAAPANATTCTTETQGSGTRC